MEQTNPGVSANLSNLLIMFGFILRLVLSNFVPTIVNFILIGSFFMFFKQKLSQKQFALVHPKKKEKRGYRHSGEIVVDKILIEREYTFLEYIQV